VRDEKIRIAVEKSNIEKPFNPVVKEKEYLSINEACLLIGASRWTLYRLIESQKIIATKIGRRTIVKKSTIDNLFNPTL